MDDEIILMGGTPGIGRELAGSPIHVVGFRYEASAGRSLRR